MNKYHRTVDNALYARPRYGLPKEAFKQAAALLRLSRAGAKDTPRSLLDVGCASGAFLHYIQTINPHISLLGVEYSRKLVRTARNSLAHRGIAIRFGDANRLPFQDSQFDFVTEMGVTSIFDDFRPAFEEMIRVAKSGGRCDNLLLLNELPVDVMIRYAHPGTRKFESGWNKFSLRSIALFLKEHPQVSRVRFVKHEMPFDLPRRKDLMRSWTAHDARGRRILWNGLNMEISMYHVIFDVRK